MEIHGLLSRPPDEGARLLALGFLDQAAAAYPRLSDPADAEALHDFRVALRRLRSCLRSYRPLLEASVPRKLAKKLRKLAQATGPGRDTEVQIEWLRPRAKHLAGAHRAGLSWLLARLEERMRGAYGELTEHLEAGFPGVEQKLRRRLSVYRTEVHLDPSGRRPTLADATAEILRGQIAELETHLARIEESGDEHEAHEARISAKRLRYLLEPFAGELAPAGPVVKRLKAVQDLLGELHDAHVLETELRESIDIAAAERARKLFDVSLQEVPDEQILRAERRRSRESGLIALARLNRNRRDRLFDRLEKEWLEGAAADFLRDVEQLAEALGSAPAAPQPSADGAPGGPSPPAPIGANFAVSGSGVKDDKDSKDAKDAG
ncbi:MAG TPA: CHAD domain-containing protein [Thermoanaerobaculia bacterium]